MKKQGIVLGGNLIVDRVKSIDVYPIEGTVAYILAMRRGIGGCPANNAINLKTLDPSLPIAVLGCVGDDEDGYFIRQELQQRQIDISGIRDSKTRPTASTDVMAARASGQRTFFHERGANAEWDISAIPFERFSNFQIVQLGYILLLDNMDAEDTEYGTVMARTLARFQQLGLQTAVDVVSEDSERFARLIPPALQYVDYLILNEWEAGHTVGISLRDDAGRLQGQLLPKAAKELLAVGHSECVVIHMPEGGYALTRNREEMKLPSFLLPEDEIVGSVGAGDAFCSGVLYGLAQAMPLVEALRLGNILAACNLFAATATGGAMSLQAARRKMQAYPLRPLLF